MPPHAAAAQASLEPRTLNPRVWGPHYWFTLHTITRSYPEYPNDVTRKKYYALIQNLPLFIPIPDIGNRFAELLDKYPVTPYLDSRESFMKWMHFIHNKVRSASGSTEMDNEAAVAAYAEAYHEAEPTNQSSANRRSMMAYVGMATIWALVAVILHNKG